MNSTNLILLTLLLKNLCADPPTNTLPPVVLPLFTYTNTFISTDWVQTADLQIVNGIGSNKWVMDSVSTNTQREVVTAIIAFRTNQVPLSLTRVMLAGDTNALVK